MLCFENSGISCRLKGRAPLKRTWCVTGAGRADVVQPCPCHLSSLQMFPISSFLFIPRLVQEDGMNANLTMQFKIVLDKNASLQISLQEIQYASAERHADLQKMLILFYERGTAQSKRKVHRNIITVSRC